MIAPAAPASVLSQTEARDLTDRIRSTAESLCDLLLQAHEGKAYVALGYDTWNEYVKAELNVSRRRAFQLLQEAGVRKQLASATGTECNALHFSGRSGREVADRLPEVIEVARQKIEVGASPAEAVSEAVDEVRSRPAPASDEEPEPEDEHPDLAAELERAYEENNELRQTVEQLTANDVGREILSLNAKYAQLNGRVQQLLEESGRYKREASQYSNLLKRIRSELKVDTNAEILEAIHDLKR